MFIFIRWFCLWGALVLPLSAQAQTSPALDEKLSYIFQVSEIEEGFDVGFSVFKPRLMGYLQNSIGNPTPEIAAYISELIDEEFTQLKPEIVAFTKGYYKRQSTEEELSTLYDFYRTPIGSRLASKFHKVSAGFIPEMQAFMTQQFAPRISVRLSNDAKLRDALRP